MTTHQLLDQLNVAFPETYVPVQKVRDGEVSIQGNKLTFTEFIARMGALGFDETSIPAYLDRLVDGGTWVLTLPADQGLFLKSPGNFRLFKRNERKGFGN